MIDLIILNFRNIRFNLREREILYLLIHLLMKIKITIILIIT
jgi:hypothetical protein